MVRLSISPCFLMMSRIGSLVLVLLQVQPWATVAAAYTRADFPSDFIFGAGTAAYQVEGAAFEDGRTASIWDTYTHDGRVSGYTGDVAADQYHRYKEDVQLMADTGLDAYRFSISWSRLIPNGKGPVNPKGVEYYNNLINELIHHGIQPHVVLYHLDLPQALEDGYEGWVNQQIVRDFTAYANVCFREFGDRVQHWTTYNEPNALIGVGYDTGTHPPQRCSAPFGSCTRGNSSTEPYMVAHNMLLAHASVVKLYRSKYQGNQHGFVGLTVLATIYIPESDTNEDRLATQRAADFLTGWFIHPLVFGDYPDIMRKLVGNRLPSFSKRESELVKNSFDFIGVNCYTDTVVRDNPNSINMEPKHYLTDSGAEQVALLPMMNDTKVCGHVLEVFKQVYRNPPVYIHENGYPTMRGESLEDKTRIQYLRASIGGVLDAARNGSNVRGYILWSFLDLFEMAGGYEMGFGLYHVDFLNDPDLKRHPRLSAHWYSSFLKGSTSVNIIQQVSSFNYSTPQTMQNL